MFHSPRILQSTLMGISQRLYGAVAITGVMFGLTQAPCKGPPSQRPQHPLTCPQPRLNPSYLIAFAAAIVAEEFRRRNHGFKRAKDGHWVRAKSRTLTSMVVPLETHQGTSWPRTFQWLAREAQKLDLYYFFCSPPEVLWSGTWLYRARRLVC